MADTKWYRLAFIGGSSKCIDIAPALGIDADTLNPGDVVAAALKIIACSECSNTRYSIDVQGVLKEGTPAAKAFGDDLPVLVIEGTHSAYVGENQYTLNTWSGKATVVAGVGREYITVRDTPPIPNAEKYYEGVTLSGLLIPYPDGSNEAEENSLNVIEKTYTCPFCAKKGRIYNEIVFSEEGGMLLDILGLTSEDVGKNVEYNGHFSFVKGEATTDTWKYSIGISEDDKKFSTYTFMDYMVSRYKEPELETFNSIKDLIERMKEADKKISETAE